MNTERNSHGLLTDLSVAFQFLTRLPMPYNLNPDARALGSAAGWFPVVGAVVGGAMGLAVHAAITLGISLGLAAVAAVTLGVLLTGAFHEDGLADSMDGFGGGWSREQVLAIMRDSRIGSYGAIAVVLLIFFRVAALWSTAPAAWFGALVGAHTMARWSSLWLLRTSTYARREDESPGFGKPFVEKLSNSSFAFGTACAAGIGVLVAGYRGLIAMGAAAVISSLWAAYCKRRIGGLTGDALGAANAMTEVFVLVCWSIALPASSSPWSAS